MSLLKDIVVVDFSQFLSGPSAALRLADMGGPGHQDRKTAHW